jgi:hypothetical protein
MIQSHHTLRLETQDLADDFPANRPTCSCDQYPLALEELADGGEVGGHRRSGQEVGDLQVAYIERRSMTIEHCPDLGNDTKAHPVIEASVQHAAGKVGATSHHQLIH